VRHRPARAALLIAALAVASSGCFGSDGSHVLRVDLPSGFVIQGDLSLDPPVVPGETTLDEYARSGWTAVEPMGDAVNENGCRIGFFFVPRAQVAEDQLVELGRIEGERLRGEPYVEMGEAWIQEGNGVQIYVAVHTWRTHIWYAVGFRSFWGSPLGARFQCPSSVEPRRANDLAREFFDALTRATIEERPTAP
jgi:hypothetical protein